MSCRLLRLCFNNLLAKIYLKTIYILAEDFLPNPFFQNYFRHYAISYEDS